MDTQAPTISYAIYSKVWSTALWDVKIFETMRNRYQDADVFSVDFIRPD
jgi:hypothetical protein